MFVRVLYCNGLEYFDYEYYIICRYIYYAYTCTLYFIIDNYMQFFGNNGGHVRIRVVKSSLHNELKHINI